jgi:hypothetical protein
MHLLADSLIRNETLRILDLKNNLLADDAVHALVVGLRANRGLRRLGEYPSEIFFILVADPG